MIYMLTYATWTKAMHACRSFPERAMKLLGRMQQRGVAPDMISYNTLMHSASVSPWPPPVLELPSCMVASGPG